VLTKAVPASRSARNRGLTSGPRHARGSGQPPADPGPAEAGPRHGLLDRLSAAIGTEAGALLTGVSVYREPADRNAVLFQVGLHDWTAARTPGTHGPTAPYQAPASLAGLISDCEQGGLLSLCQPGDVPADSPALFMDRLLAAEWQTLLSAAGRRAELAAAHRRAAEYWQWRAAAWPQGRAADIDDLLTARQHLLDAGDLDHVATLTAGICAQLRAWGHLEQERDLIQETLAAMPSPSAGCARWLHELAVIAQARGEQAAAEQGYLRSVQMSAEVGDAGGVARGYESLGVLAQARGDYRKAEHCYREAAAAEFRADASAFAPSDGPADASGSAGRPTAPSPLPPAQAPPPGRPWWRGPRVVLAALTLSVVVASVTIAMTQLAGHAASAGAAGSHDMAAAERLQAASWVSRQVSHSAVVGCDPAMCAALRARGMPSGALLMLGPGAGADPLGSDIVMATAAVRGELGTRLGSVYAPLVLASFGTGGARVDVLATAPDGAAAYRRALASDQLARRAAGAALIRNRRLSLTPTAQLALTQGRVDTRLLTTITALAQLRPLRVIGFSDAGPGADPAAPLRSAELAAPGSARPLAAFLRAQRPPYLASSVSMTTRRAGQLMLRLEFGDPSPLGLLPATPNPAPAGTARSSPAPPGAPLSSAAPSSAAPSSAAPSSGAPPPPRARRPGEVSSRPSG
jgi:hypothetical protein